MSLAVGSAPAPRASPLLPPLPSVPPPPAACVPSATAPVGGSAREVCPVPTLPPVARSASPMARSPSDSSCSCWKTSSPPDSSSLMSSSSSSSDFSPSSASSPSSPSVALPSSDSSGSGLLSMLSLSLLAPDATSRCREALVARFVGVFACASGAWPPIRASESELLVRAKAFLKVCVRAAERHRLTVAKIERKLAMARRDGRSPSAIDAIEAELATVWGEHSVLAQAPVWMSVFESLEGGLVY
eukprot:scaffold34966_cov99-Isochrysis_galbana.AAC.2